MRTTSSSFTSYILDFVYTKTVFVKIFAKFFNFGRLTFRRLICIIEFDVDNDESIVVFIFILKVEFFTADSRVGLPMNRSICF